MIRGPRLGLCGTAPAAADTEDAPPIDLSGDVYRGPVMEIDGEGNVIRIVPGERGSRPRAPEAPAGTEARPDSTVVITIPGRP